MDEDRMVRVMETGFDTLAELLGQTNARLDRNQAQTNERLDALDHRLERLEGRFDHFIDLAGQQTRDLRLRVERLEAHTGITR